MNDNKEHDYDLYDQRPTSPNDVDVGIDLTPEQAEAIGFALAKSGMVIPTSLVYDLVCEACKAKVSSRGQSQKMG